MSDLFSNRLQKLRKPIRITTSNLLAIVWGLIVIFPFYLVVITALKDPGTIVIDRLSPPDVWHWENLLIAWQKGHFSVYFKNSVVVTTLTVGFTLFFSFLAAYAFARMSFPGKNLLYLIFMIGLAIPGDVLLIPMYYLLKNLKLTNTLWALILPGIGFGVVFAILILRSFIETLPNEIMEAGIMDGCSEIQLARHIVLPLCRPALLSLLILNFMWNWNSFIWPVVLIQKDEWRTITVGLNFFQGRYLTNIPLLMAGTLIIALPVVVIYILFQREFVKGIAARAVK